MLLMSIGAHANLRPLEFRLCLWFWLFIKFLHEFLDLLSRILLRTLPNLHLFDHLALLSPLQLIAVVA